MLPSYVLHQPGVSEGHTYDLVQAQKQVEKVLDPIVSKAHLDSFLLEDVDLAVGSNDINHKLGRKLRGWHVVRDDAPLINIKASLSGAQSVNNVSLTLVQMDTLSGQGTANFSTTAYQFTAPVAGIYAATSVITFDDLADGKQGLIQITKNTSTDLSNGQQHVGAATVDPSVTAASTEALSADDTLDVRAYHNHGSARNILADDAYSNLYITLLTNLSDDQANSPDQTKCLRLYSACARTVSLVVF